MLYGRGSKILQKKLDKITLASEILTDIAKAKFKREQLESWSFWIFIF